MIFPIPLMILNVYHNSIKQYLAKKTTADTDDTQNPPVKKISDWERQGGLLNILAGNKYIYFPNTGLELYLFG